MAFRPVSDDQTLSMKIVDQIKRAIAEKQYLPGEKLPAERELSEAFQVSRTVVRDALKILAGLGLIAIRQGVGAFVTEAGPDEAARQLVEGMAHQKDSLRSLFEIRKVLEAEGAAWAAMRCRPEQIEKLQDHMRQAMALVQREDFRPEEARSMNEAFHQLVASASQNELLPAVLTNLRQLLQGKRRENFQDREWAARSVSEHARIVAAIKNRDAEAARWAMKQHLGDVEETELSRLSLPAGTTQ